MVVNFKATLSPTFDFRIRSYGACESSNRNMTSDGTNTYQWDAENRLIQINYPGSGNNSRFLFDGLSLNTAVQEFSAGSLTSTSQFVWCGKRRSESRDAMGTLTAQFFELGLSIAGVKSYISRDRLNCLRELTSETGAISAQFAYDPNGVVKAIQDSPSNLYLFANLFNHSRSGLSLSLARPYSASLTRWISKDPGGEVNGINLYAYVFNNPTNYSDPLGLGPLEGGTNNNGFPGGRDPNNPPKYCPLPTDIHRPPPNEDYPGIEYNPHLFPDLNPFHSPYPWGGPPLEYDYA